MKLLVVRLERKRDLELVLALGVPIAAIVNLSLDIVPFAVTRLNLVERVLRVVELALFDQLLDVFEHVAEIGDLDAVLQIFQTVVVRLVELGQLARRPRPLFALGKALLLVLLAERAVGVLDLLLGRVVFKSQDQIRVLLHLVVLLNNSAVFSLRPYQMIFVITPSNALSSTLSNASFTPR